jgi:hypothetical protein
LLTEAAIGVAVESIEALKAIGDCIADISVAFAVIGDWLARVVGCIAFATVV